MGGIREQFAKFKQFDDLIQTTAQKYQVDPSLVHRVVQQESAYNPRAVSRVGAQGLMQLMPGTAKDLGVADPFDAAQNIEGGVKYLSQMLKRYGGDVNKALMAYNAGPGNVDSGKALSFPETQDYVRRINPARNEMPTGDVKSAFEQWKASQAAVKPAQAPVSAPDAPKPTPKPSLLQSGLEGAKSLLENASPMSTLKNLGILDAVTHPMDTINSVLDIGRHPVENLPTIAGTAASIAGGGKRTPVGAAFAAAGGAGGAGLRNIIDAVIDPDTLVKRGVTTTGDVLKDMGTEGAIQGGAELIGRGGQALLKGGARGLVKHALHPSIEALSMAPTLIDDAIQQGVSLSRKGLEKAKGVTTGLRNAADALIDNTHAQGAAPVALDDVIGGLHTTPQGGQSVEEWIKHNVLDKVGAGQKLDTFENMLRQNYPADMSLPEVRDLARTAGREGSRVFEGVEDPAFREKMAAGVNDSARSILQGRVGGLAEKDAATRKALFVQNALKDALEYHSNKPPSYMRHGAAGALGAAGTFLANPLVGLGMLAGTEVLSNPRVEMALGKGLFNAGQLPYAQILRALQLASGTDNTDISDPLRKSFQ